VPNRKVVKMNYREIAPGIVVFSDVIANSENLPLEIEEGISVSNLNWSKAYVKSGDEIKIDDSTRSTETIVIPHIKEPSQDYSSTTASFYTSLSNLFLESFAPIEAEYKAMYGVDVRTHEQYSILKYGVGQNFVNHVDDYFEGPRRMSHVHYLNEDYEGGEIVFPRFGITYKPKANESIFFPSGYVYNHSVNPVISGQRYAIVSWLY
jgi:predicted 2-oxoglutarate/Fe(II)-dependent dioxygenase YbiX